MHRMSASNTENTCSRTVSISIRPLTHAPETGSRNLRHRPKFDARFRRQFFVPLHDFENLAPESGVEMMAQISGAAFWRMCQGPNVCITVSHKRITNATRFVLSVCRLSLPLVYSVGHCLTGDLLHFWQAAVHGSTNMCMSLSERDVWQTTALYSWIISTNSAAIERTDDDEDYWQQLLLLWLICGRVLSLPGTSADVDEGSNPTDDLENDTRRWDVSASWWLCKAFEQSRPHQDWTFVQINFTK